MDVSITTICVVAPSTCAEPHLHQREQRHAEQIGRVHRAHRQAELELAPQVRGIGSPGDVRLVGVPQVVPQEDAECERHAAQHAGVGRPRGPGDAPVEFEDEDLVQHHVDDADQRRRHDRDPGARNAIEEPEDGPQHHADRRTEHARTPVIERVALHLWVEPERAEQRAAEPGEAGEQRQRQHCAPQCNPGRMAGSPASPAALGLRDEGLHGESHAPEQHHEEEHQPEDRRHPRHRGRRDVTDEPGVRQADHGLQAAVDHQRQRERRNRAVVDDRAAIGAEALRRQGATAARHRDGGRCSRIAHGTDLSAACGGARTRSRLRRGTAPVRRPTARSGGHCPPSVPGPARP